MHECMNARHDMTRNHMKWHETKGNAIDKGMKVWMNQWRNAWVNEWIAPAPTFFLDFYVKSSSRYIPVHFCRPLYPIEPRNRGNRDPPSATTAATLPEKMQGFAPEIVFKPEFTHSDLSHFPTTCMILHDDVVAMMVEVMMWLSSWWET